MISKSLYKIEYININKNISHFLVLGRLQQNRLPIIQVTFLHSLPRRCFWKTILFDIELREDLRIETLECVLESVGAC